MSPYPRRLERLRRKLAASDLEALLVTRGENRRYLSGLRSPDPSPTSSAGWVLVAADRAVLLANFTEYEAARQQVVDAEVVLAKGGLRDAAARVLADFRRAGFEESHLAYGTYRELTVKLNGRCELVPTVEMVEELRVVKDADELATIRRAAALTDQAFQAVASSLRPGVTEREMAWALERFARENGGEEMAFRPSVASGPNTVLPHAGFTDRPIAAGEPVFIDLGARVDGYCADLTRSFCLRRADGRYRETYQAVLEAQLAAERAIRAGMTGQEADGIARRHLEQLGLAEAFGHNLGHGVGLMVHEAPRLYQASPDVLAEGMVVTVEPGVYLPGWGGVRIEDLVVIQTDGIEVLSGAPKEPVIGGDA